MTTPTERELEIELALAKSELAAERENALSSHRALVSVRAKNEKLRKALEPFARWCDEMEGEGPRLADEARVSADITMGDCRRARAALKETGGE